MKIIYFLKVALDYHYFQWYKWLAIGKKAIA